MLKTKDFAAEQRIKPDTARVWRWRGIGPRFVKIGRTVYYRHEDVDAWRRALPSFASTAEEKVAKAKRQG
jgi:hypothetical protein